MSEDLVQLADTAAAHLERVAAELVGPSFGQPDHEARWMTSTQIRTVADEQAGAALDVAFARSFPGHGRVIEDREPVGGDGVHEWHIDPIDGSANHLRGVPYVALTCGLLRDGLPVLGVVHDLLNHVTYTATSGGGAWRVAGGERTPMAVSSITDLADSMTVMHLARRGPLMGRVGALERLLWSVRKIRCMGSIALDLALLAGGQVDLLVAGRGRPQRLLDILGGLVLLREAGGAAVDADGVPLRRASRTLVAGPPALCEAFVHQMLRHELEAWHSDETQVPDDL